MKQVKPRPLDLGQYPRRLRKKPLAYMAEWVAGLLALIWLVAVLSYVLAQPTAQSTASSTMLTMVVVFFPITLIFGVLITLRSVRALRAEAARLQASVDAMRKAFLAGQGPVDVLAQPNVTRKLDEIAEQTLQTQAVLATMAASVAGNGTARAARGGAAGQGSAMQQPKSEPRPEEPPLALGQAMQEVSPPLSVEDFIRALHFPNGPEDVEGFAAMRAALGHRDIAILVRAAQNVLKLLAQDGIYMDELKHDPAPPEPWRQFAKGQRGQPVSALGGVRDRTALALSVGRLRNDAIFRDAAHHFLRAFDRCLIEFEPNADDKDLMDLAKTRSARAFMLLGRVLGTFD